MFGGIGVAAAVTAATMALGAGLEPAGPVWAAAVVWTVLATVAHALWRGFRFGDWSTDRDCEVGGMDRDTFDWSTRTGAYTYMRLAEQDEHLMRGNTY